MKQIEEKISNTKATQKDQIVTENLAYPDQYKLSLLQQCVKD